MREDLEALENGVTLMTKKNLEGLYEWV
jgi:hypothetical protein